MKGTRLIASATLAAPVLAGIAYLAIFGAPSNYARVNGIALGVAALVVFLSPRLSTLETRRLVAVILLTLLFLPLITGPAISGISRWLPLGPVVLHSGMLAVPLLVVFAARDERYTEPILLAAIFAALLQPDGATGLALTFAAVGLYNATRDWKAGVVAGTGFIASLVMWMRGELPAQPFVERVLVDAAMVEPLAAVGLFLALIASFFLILHALPGAKAPRHALAGTLFGFSLAAVLSNYPSALIGYGAAPILGFGLALSQFAKPPASPHE
ncbi:hypothetical protein P8Q88_03345 [Qipengyuania sp. XHP0207]|uniref:hypothetical protein n=1 Tax=Qipengyuania sp. XHP0207 TaxID=3038078 RepID=UPI00241F09C3|nr:hypothetical protein [Qipengyuania sp. XHP0207]MDG5747206.1 hypothetical protein [Qipengyuania sp. XHP0207]